ncbi:hypothetical protein Zmor_011457 [Zophobas morio]|uniref:Reverse transcriptase domain-containing protein n=1 Tax=Zophobas morio TaxID=2755281 RepID=A0AA38IT79_9CUCU|nr:hypothetical protein Zmor_011457 [Zophobas morio]
MLVCVNDWTLALDSEQPRDIAYLDFSKAFDRVPKERLLFKLQSAGIRGKLLNWIRAFLSNRTFKVRVGSDFSQIRPVQSAVPQGSILGPLLFLVFTSDIPKLIHSNIAMFADDIKLYSNPLKDPGQLQSDLTTIKHWSDAWLLPLNQDKCTILRLGKNNPCVNYQINDTTIKVVAEQVDLGITVTSDLSWSSHINKICHKANKMLYPIGKTFQHISSRSAKKLYTTYVRPVLEFGGPVWYCSRVSDKNRLELTQRRATRLSFGTNRPSYEERLRLWNLPTFEQRKKEAI